MSRIFYTRKPFRLQVRCHRLDFWPRAHVDCVVHQSEAGKQLHEIEEAEEAKRQKLLAESSESDMCSRNIDRMLRHSR